MSKSLGGVLQGNETVFLTQDEINNPYADIPTMIEDKKRKRKQMKPNIFDRITQSPEVLAVEFVGMMYDRVLCEDKYYSMLTGEFYNSYEEAIAATVARLKEMAE